MGTRSLDEEDFWKRVDIGSPNSCWEWLARKHKAYGQLTYQGIPYKAHRLAWTLHYKQNIPEGKVIMHLCDNPGCCNPAHLKLGTQLENIQQAVLQKKYHRPGELNSNAKLTSEIVGEIRSTRKAAKYFVKRYGISRFTVYAIRKERIWKDHPSDNIWKREHTSG